MFKCILKACLRVLRFFKSQTLVLKTLGECHKRPFRCYFIRSTLLFFLFRSTNKNHQHTCREIPRCNTYNSVKTVSLYPIFSFLSVRLFIFSIFSKYLFLRHPWFSFGWRLSSPLRMWIRRFQLCRRKWTVKTTGVRR